MIDFAVLPPEINSARMYTGPGSASMLAAGSSWNQIAAEMRSAAASYESAISALTDESWFGPSSTMMLAAVTPYLQWLGATAAQAEQAGNQANAAAAAYETAFAMTIPPAAIAANRAQLSNLMATNLFGQNTAAIATTEAQYAEMWAQDATAMNGYASASNTATQLTPFTSPQSTTATDGVAGQSNAVAQAANVSTASSNSASATSSLAEWLGIAPNTNTSTTGLAGVMNFLDGSNGSLVGSFLNNASVANISNGFTTSGLTNPTSMIDTVTAFSYLTNPPGAAAAAPSIAASSAAMETASAGLPTAAAQLGRANLVGSLSVPPAWAGAGATINAVPMATTQMGAGAYRSLGATPMVMEDMGPMGIPGMPLGGIGDAADDEFASMPTYGFRPRILGRPPAAG
ncbi:PPE family protein [Mycobacterium vicinigordonae]|uniref:PPE family protein n=1 Tax=Mycobacterium vicinigordonae TaxID=1719132 RepID=A0A7D6DVN6_9MYCO|nr:PPE family protein [Mycobacterium vicinigordonae]QLL05924.1 PPE family protein [Mycobacterium vicinigordonae]